MATAEDLDEVIRKVKFRRDSRMPCKYGHKCYRTGTAHHEKYKHPPDKQESEKKSDDTIRPPLKKVKLSDSEEDSCEPGTNKTNDITKVILPSDIKEAIKEAFLVEMPDDFYSFWEYCRSIKKQNPADSLKEVGLILVGPFDFFEKKDDFKHCKKSDFLRHWRYYFDPPEFQTVMKGDDKTEYHLGYFRDDPGAAPCFVGSNSSAVDCTIAPVAENLFGAVNSYLETRKGKSDPFHKMKISSLQKSLQAWAKDKDFHLETSTPAMRTRARRVNAKTFHKAGMVVPVNKEMDTGYRPLLETEANLKKLLNNYAKSANEDERKALMNKLQPIITAANIANDECDFGTSLELGLDMFCTGGEMLHTMTLHLLCTAYSLLDRNVFAEILKAHLQDRKNGVNLSIIGKAD